MTEKLKMEATMDISESEWVDGHVSDGALLRLVDDEPVTEGDQLRAHLSECSACAARLDLARRSSSALSNVLAASAPAPMDDIERARLRKAVQARVARKPRRRWNSPALRA